jgi:predicted ATPase
MATRGVEGVETHMVGRDAEFLQLKQRFEQMAEQRQGQVVVVRGEAGIGKSRLLHEFEKWLDGHARVVTAFRGRATPEMVHVPYGIWRDLFRNRFDILENDSAELARQKFKTGMSGFLQADEAQWVGALVGFDFADSRVANVLGSPNFARTARAYLLAYLRGIAHQNPVVLFFEDVHWADEASLELITQLSEELATESVLCVVLTRPALFERLPKWGAGQALVQMELQPLSAQDSERLVREILSKVADLPEALCEMVVQNADGNPFYVEELIKVLLDDGVILRGENCWQVEMERLQRTHIPTTLTELLQARLDSLPPAEAELLQHASIFGRVFWDAALEKLHAPGDRLLDVSPLLKSVVQRELVYPRERPAFAGMGEYTFKHALLRDVAYHMVLLKLRRIYHRQAAEWLETVGGARLNEYAGVIAGHYEQAGAAAEAANWFERAGSVALRSSAPAQALNAFERAWKLLPEVPDERLRLRLLLGRGRALERMGDYGAALEQYTQAESAAFGDDALWIEALGALGGIQMRLGQYDEAQVTIERQIEKAKRIGDELSLAQAFRTLGSLAYYQGNYAEAIERIRQALALEIQYQRKTGMASCLSSLGVIAWMQGDYENAKTWLNESLQLNREIGDPSGAAAALTNLGLVMADEGDFEAAMHCYQQAMAIEQQVGNQRGLCGLLNNIGNLYSSMGDAEQAQRYYEQGLPLARKIGDPTVTSRLLMNLGWGAVLRGELTLAQQYTRESLQMMREIGDREGEATCLQNLAYALCGDGDCGLAEHMLRQALQIAKEIEVPSLVLECMAGFGYLLAVQGWLQRAAELIGLALGHAQTNSDVSMAAEFGLRMLRQSLPEEALAQTMQRGAALDLQAVTEALLEG